MKEKYLTISEILSNINQEWSELSKLTTNTYSINDIRNTTLIGLSNNYHDFGLRYSLIPLAISAHEEPKHQNKDVLNLTYCLSTDWVREIWDMTNKRNYFLDLWGHYEFFFRVLFNEIVPKQTREGIEQFEKNKYKIEPKKVHIPIIKITSAVLNSTTLEEKTKKNLNKFTNLFLHIRNTFHNNSISEIDYSYGLLDTETIIKKNEVVDCLDFERCYKFAKKSILVIQEISFHIGDDEIINTVILLRGDEK